LWEKILNNISHYLISLFLFCRSLRTVFCNIILLTHYYTVRGFFFCAPCLERNLHKICKNSSKQCTRTVSANQHLCVRQADPARLLQNKVVFAREITAADPYKIISIFGSDRNFFKRLKSSTLLSFAVRYWEVVLETHLSRIKFCVLLKNFTSTLLYF